MKPSINLHFRSSFLFTLVLSLLFCFSSAQPVPVSNDINRGMQQNESIRSAKKINPTTIEVLLSDDHRMVIDFYGENIFRVFQDNSGGAMRDPESKPEAKILVNNPRRTVSKLALRDEHGFIGITTAKINVQ